MKKKSTLLALSNRQNNQNNNRKIFSYLIHIRFFFRIIHFQISLKWMTK